MTSALHSELHKAKGAVMHSKKDREEIALKNNKKDSQGRISSGVNQWKYFDKFDVTRRKHVSTAVAGGPPSQGVDRRRW